MGAGVAGLGRAESSGAIFYLNLIVPKSWLKDKEGERRDSEAHSALACEGEAQAELLPVLKAIQFYLGLGLIPAVVPGKNRNHESSSRYSAATRKRRKNRDFDALSLLLSSTSPVHLVRELDTALLVSPRALVVKPAPQFRAKKGGACSSIVSRTSLLEVSSSSLVAAQD